MDSRALFRYEEEMHAPVREWLVAQGLRVREQFQTPFGICDLVACTLDPHRVAERRELRQLQTIGPPIRVHIWHRVPDLSTGESISVRNLSHLYAGLLASHELQNHLRHLLESGFLTETSRGRLQKVNGWHPLHEELLAIELKLRRVEEGLAQATRYLGFADHAYLALPLATALRCLDRMEAEPDRPVGILGVTLDGVECLWEPAIKDRVDDVYRTHAVERFWRESLKDSSS